MQLYQQQNKIQDQQSVINSLLQLNQVLSQQNKSSNDNLVSLSIQTMHDVNKLQQENQRLRAKVNKPPPIIVQGNKTRKVSTAKKRTKPITGELSYGPADKYRVKKNVHVPRELAQILKQTIDYKFDNAECGTPHNGKPCKCDGLYLYLDAIISMQFNNASNRLNDGGSRVFNIGLVNNKTNEDIYLVIDEEKSDSVVNKKNHRKAKWKMQNEIHTKSTIPSQCKIQPPSDIKNTGVFREQLKQKKVIDAFLNDSQAFQSLIKKTNWSKIPLIGRVNNNRRRPLLIRKPEFIKDIENKNNMDNKSTIPIIMYNKNTFEIHHVLIVEIDKGINIGISLIYNQTTKKVKVTGMHTDKSLLMKAHQWISLKHKKECRCFDNFRSTINHLSIGNPDDAQNRLNAMRIEKNKLEQEVKRLKNRLRFVDPLSSPSLSSSNDFTFGVLNDSSASND